MEVKMLLWSWLKGLFGKSSKESCLDEVKDNPILKYIRAQQYSGPGTNLEIPNLQNAYKLWCVGKQGHRSILTSSEAQTWFGHSLFTANVRQYLAYEKLIHIIHYCSSDKPTIPQYPSPNIQAATYEAPVKHLSGDSLQLERYDVISAFFSDLVSALDVMGVGLAYLYDFAGIITCLGLQGDFTVDRMDFGKILSFVRKVSQNAGSNQTCNIPTNFIQLMQQENLHQWNGTTKTTGCQWYDDLSLQRNYHSHVGFPLLYVENGEWKLSADPRGPTPDAVLTDELPSFCQDIFDNVHRFMGEVYGAVWADFSSKLPK
jgi:hypothetical protein